MAPLCGQWCESLGLSQHACLLSRCPWGDAWHSWFGLLLSYRASICTFAGKGRPCEGQARTRHHAAPPTEAPGPGGPRGSLFTVDGVTGTHGTKTGPTRQHYRIELNFLFLHRGLEIDLSRGNRLPSRA